jgi:transporter family protein
MNWLFFAALSVAFAVIREITQKEALQHEHTLEYLTVRSIIIATICLGFIPAVDFSLPLRAYALLAIGATLITAGIIYRNRSLKHEDISIVQPLMNTQPLFLTLVAFIFLGETLSYLQLGGILLLVAGTYWLELDHTEPDLLSPIRNINNSRYAKYVLGAAVILAFANTIDRYVLTTYTDWLSYYVIIWLMISAMMIIWQWLNYGLSTIGHVMHDHGKEIIWPSLLSMGMVLALYKSLAMAPAASLVVAIYRTQSVFTTIKGGQFFHEDHVHRRGAACTVMALGAILIIL